MSGAKVDKARARFDALRAKYLAAKKKRDDMEVDLRVKYGSEHFDLWAKPSERNAYEWLRQRQSDAGDAIFAHVQAISPRDWSRSVPVHWVYEELTYEDAVRPLGEPLSVVPPMSYSATEVMR